MGRGVTLFSISTAIACASEGPTQIGRIAVPFTSLRTTIGRLLSGSIIKPRIFISTSMRSPFLPTLSVYTLARQRIRSRARDANVDVLTGDIGIGGRPQEIERLVLRGADRK